ncbi:MAG: DUF4469 domain-containing protein [Marinilabiliaceae bacterium]|nr:DUF4469 domain-containing protein [Marinilabiliaceae bacterium]
MALRYGLVPNHLTDDPNDCMAVTTENETISKEAIVEQMIGKGSTITKAEALSVIEEFEYAVVDAVKSGNNVNTELFKISPSIVGVFNDSNDGFDTSRHAVKINLNAGKRLSEVADQIDLRKVSITAIQPIPQKFIDLITKVTNESFTAGQVASIRGSNLKFDAADSNQGIFFIDKDGNETRVDNLIKNYPSELLFIVPAVLTTGSYEVEIRCVYHKSKSLRKGRFAIDLVPVN